MGKIIELLKEVEITYGSRRWMVWCGSEWRVINRKPYARKNIILYAGEDLEKALTVLLGDTNER